MPSELIPKFMSPNKVISIVILVAVILLGMNAFETVEKGTYQIRQFPVTGTFSFGSVWGLNTPTPMAL